MTTALRAIDPGPYLNQIGDLSSDAGPFPTLQWIAIEKLRIDPAYQRDVGGRGAANIRKIAREFNWSKFAPVIVAHAGAGLYSIIDGQHRTIAAAVRGIAKVPCHEVEADQARQADAFAAINSQITAVTPMQLHAARLAARDPEASELAAICAQAGVTICRFPTPADKMKPGETNAVGAIARNLKSYGREVLIDALACITKTGKGNPGMVRQQVIGALCVVLDAEPDWRKSQPKLLHAMSGFNFVKAWTEAGQASFVERCSIGSKLAEAITDHLERELA